MTVTIIDIASHHHADFLRLWQGFLDFYDHDLSPAVSQATWRRLIDPDVAMYGRLALLDRKIAGFAIHTHHPSTWVAGDDCYLEDLFIDPAARGHGLGRALIDDVIGIARAKGWHRLYWYTDHDNGAARALYDSYVPSDGHVRYRMTL
jgi:GNAT superfamily N-acetyltransferase